jgi:hypothetical protein
MRLDPTDATRPWFLGSWPGQSSVTMGTQARGASNAKAKGELSWTLRFPSWREGFPAADASQK